MRTHVRQWIPACLMILLSPFLLGAGGTLPPAPEVRAEKWLNSEPLDIEGLRGKVVLVEFWTFGCWNCKNVEPYIIDWHKKYQNDGLVIIGVHTPEFAYEQKLGNLRRYLEEHGITYPVAVDNNFGIWHAFNNWAWPTVYLIGKQGHIRYKRIGEGGYKATEETIRALLNE